MESKRLLSIKGAKNHWYSSFPLQLSKELSCGREKTGEGSQYQVIPSKRMVKKVSDEQINEFLLEEITAMATTIDTASSQKFFDENIKSL